MSTPVLLPSQLDVQQMLVYSSFCMPPLVSTPHLETTVSPQGNFSSYLYGDLLTTAASSEALESILQSAFSANGDSLSSSSLGGQSMPAGCDADLAVCCMDV